MKVKVTIEFTKVEADELLILLDALLKSTGLQYVNNCGYYSQKIKTAFQMPEPKSNGVAKKTNKKKV